MSAVNWKGVFWWAILLITVGIAVSFFLYPPFHDRIVAAVQSLHLPKLPDLSTAMQFIQNNSMLLGVAASLGTTAVAYFIKNHQTNKLLDAKIQELEQAKIDAVNAANQNFSLQKQLTVLNDDTTAQELQKTLLSVTGEKEQLTSKILNLQGQVEQLQEQPKQIIQQLWQASGGKVQTIAGETVKVIELEKTLVV